MTRYWCDTLNTTTEMVFPAFPSTVDLKGREGALEPQTPPDGPLNPQAFFSPSRRFATVFKATISVRHPSLR